MKLKSLNKRETSKILEQIGTEYHCDAKKLMIDKYSFFLSEKNKVYIINNTIKEVNLEKIRINSLGMYFCELNYDNIRFSIEGSQLIGPIAKKNVLKLDDDAFTLWVRGNDLEIKEEFEGFVIIKHNNDFIGSGKFSEGKIFTYIPKIRRIMSKD